ncbi:MAG: ammonia-forming cytochrome c nitrite reductase subunit c552 [bacterium]
MRILSVLLAIALAGCSSDSNPPAPQADASADVNSADAGGDVMYPENSPEYCGTCHETHYEDWRGSMHAYATVDPIYRAMLTKGIAETEGKLDQFCIQCHAPVASKNGITPVYQDGDTWKVQFDMNEPTVGHGVVCVTCHRMESVEATKNAQFTLTERTLFGPGNSGGEAHKIEASTLLTSSLMCGTCHNVVNPKGALLENTFSEWYASPFNDGVGDDDKTCQDCHMPSYQGEIVEGKPREIHKHQFVGVDLALVDDFPYKELQLQLVTELLRSCGKLDVAKSTNNNGVRVSVTNINNGHALPSGSTADRQVWVQLVITDAQGTVVLESGMLDANGDLMDRVEGHSLTPDGDPDLLVFGSFIFNESGDHVTFPWQASRSQDFLLQPGQTGWREYEIPEAYKGVPLTAKATLRYRTFPPFLVRKLIDDGFLGADEIVAEIPIVDMAETTFEFVIP